MIDTHMVELATDHPERLTPYVKSDGGLFGFGASVTISPEALIRSGPEATRGLGNRRLHITVRSGHITTEPTPRYR